MSEEAAPNLVQSVAVSLPTEDDPWTSGGKGSATRGRTPRAPILIGGVPAVGSRSALGGNRERSR